MKTIIAIDPGASGGIAVECNGGAFCYPMPETEGDILELFRNFQLAGQLEKVASVCYLEQVGGFCGKGMPGSRMFNFGEGFGFLKGVLMTLGVRLIMVRPQEWQKHFSLGTARACASKTEWKNKLKAEAQRRFPQIKVTLKTADALLILDYARAKEAIAKG